MKISKSLIAIIAVVVIIGAWAASAYNSMVGVQEQATTALANVQSTYQRRADLIPNLVETVKGYMTHERETLEAVTNARAAVAGASTPEAAMAASGQLSQALGHLFAVAEAYPELKANSNFAQLQADLTDTENKISYARMSFNDCVLEYNNAIETFPGNIVAGSKFRTRQGFVVTDEAARQAPSVKF